MMKSKWLAGMVMAGCLFATSAFGQTVAVLEKVHSEAASARTTADHASVAKQYRLHGEALNAKAAAHEQNVKELTRASGALIHKWPGMASGRLQGEKSKAVEARRAARESMALAETHIRLAVEAQASPTGTAQRGE